MARPHASSLVTATVKSTNGVRVEGAGSFEACKSTPGEVTGEYKPRDVLLWRRLSASP